MGNIFSSSPRRLPVATSVHLWTGGVNIYNAGKRLARDIPVPVSGAKYLQCAGRKLTALCGKGRCGDDLHRDVSDLMSAASYLQDAAVEIVRTRGDLFWMAWSIDSCGKNLLKCSASLLKRNQDMESAMKFLVLCGRDLLFSAHELHMQDTMPFIGGKIEEAGDCFLSAAQALQRRMY